MGPIAAAMAWMVMLALFPLFGNWLHPEAIKTDAAASSTSEKQ